jgi:hypothetical protein
MTLPICLPFNQKKIVLFLLFKYLQYQCPCRGLCTSKHVHMHSQHTKYLFCIRARISGNADYEKSSHTTWMMSHDVGPMNSINLTRTFRIDAFITTVWDNSHLAAHALNECDHSTRHDEAYRTNMTDISTCLPSQITSAARAQTQSRRCALRHCLH